MGAMRIDAVPTRTGPTFVASRKEVRGVASFRSLRSVDIYASRERHCFIMMEDDSTLELQLRKTGTPAARAARHPVLNLCSAKSDSTSWPQPRNAGSQRMR